MAIPLTVKTPPAIEPLTLDEVKLHLRVDFNDDDALITTMMKAVRAKLEGQFYFSCITQSLVLYLDRFAQPGQPIPSYGYPMMTMYGSGPTLGPWGAMTPSWSAIDLRPPLASVTSIKYIDPTGATQTLASNKYSTSLGIPGRVFPAVNQVWPVPAIGIGGAVIIEFVSGAATVDLVPDEWKAAIKLGVDSLYENRAQTVIGTRLIAVALPEGVEDLLGDWRPMLVR